MRTIINFRQVLRLRKHLLVTLLCTVCLFGCEDSVIEDQLTEEAPPTSYAPDQGMTLMKLGRKLENPYSVENMQKALDNLRAKNPSARSLSQGITIQPSHLYIRFVPRDSTDLDLIAEDTTLYTYDYPLDYEIDSAVLGDYYHDPEIPLDKPTYQYCAVTKDYNIPNVHYELLSLLYIPEELEEDSTSEEGARMLNTGFTELLVDEALRITGNEEEEVEDIPSSARSRWRGDGRITYYDDTKRGAPRPVVGLTVRLTRWFRTRTGTTNSSGVYRIGGSRFRHSARYSYKWERGRFKIKDAWLRKAGKRGPKKRGDWNYHIASGSQQHFCDIFRAASHYYYGNIKGLRRPPFRPRMGIRALTNGALGNHSSFRRHVGAQLQVGQASRSSVQIYATTIHEIAHASHWLMDKNAFSSVSRAVKESWARGVQWELTRMTYSDYQGGSNSENYTHYFVDLIDSPENGEPNQGEEITSRDQVSGYTVRQLEDDVKGTKTMTGVNNRVKNGQSTTTKNNVDKLFNFWF
ncbi:MAG: hypothetical protein ABJQ69_03660 [Ekhidna sp.]